MDGIQMKICCTNGRTFEKSSNVKGNGYGSHRKPKDPLPVYYGGERLEGQLELILPKTKEFDAVKFSFQGKIQLQSIFQIWVKS